MLDAVRHDEPLLALGASLAAQVVVGSTAIAASVDLATVGVLLCASAVVQSGLSALYPARWRLPFVAAACQHPASPDTAAKRYNLGHDFEEV